VVQVEEGREVFMPGPLLAQPERLIQVVVVVGALMVHPVVPEAQAS
jgi:hypothetical protein